MAKISIIIILLLFLAQTSFSQRQEILFHHYTMNLEMGFSSNGSNCLLQDKQGFIWIGTYNGLNRFDGYKAKVYRYEPGETGTISDNIIDCLFEDKIGMIWVGTRTSGLNMYNPYSDIFKTYRHDPDDSSTINSDRITAIHEDQFENLWIGTDYGLNLFDRSRQKFIHFKKGKDENYVTTIMEEDSAKIWIGTYQGLYLVNSDEAAFISFEDYFSLPQHLDKYSVYTGVVDHDGTFWIGTNRGLLRFNPHDQRFTHYTLDMNKNSTDLSNVVQTILFDEVKTGTFLWIGTLNGLYKFDINNETFQRFVHNPLNDYSISHNSIQSILKDKSGCIWIGVENGGLNKASFNRDYIRHYFPNPLYRESPENDIHYFCQAKSGTVCIATPGGLWTFDKKSENFTLYQHNPKNPNSLSHNDVRCIFEDINGDIWIGTNEGLDKFEGNSSFIAYKNNPHNQYSISNNSITSICGTSDGNLIIGTWFGLNIFNPNSQKFTRYLSDPDNPNTVSENEISSVLTDNDGIIWIGTEKGGLNRFDPISGHFKRYKNDPENPQSISSNSILTIFEYPVNHQQTLWIGTSGGGLCQFDKTTDTFIRYTKKDGLRDNIVNSIAADFRGNLWLATQEGISILNLKTRAFKNFEMGIIIPRSIHACFTDQDGEMFWGGWFGLARFFPDSIKLNTYIPEIVLTDIKINNRPVQLDSVVSYKKALKLTHKENFLSFEFAVLDFNRPLSNLYAYKMEGIDPDWVVTDASRRYVSYTDLDPGEYIFHVKGSNNDGIWNEEGTSLKIIITPPWWKTDWAYAIYVLLFGIGLITTWRFQLRRIHLRNELKLKSFEARKLKEIDHMKSRFFANISHEFRTPITLILGPLSKLLTKTRDKADQHDLKLVIRNARRLQRLINQLLDLSKIEAGKMNLQTRETNLIPLIHRIVQSFESQAKLKGIHLSFRSQESTLLAYIDQEKIENILYNLLSNAFKFTPEGGKVVLGVKSNPPQSPLSKGGHRGVEITVSDTGVGIPPDRLDKIFNRFYQVDDSYIREHEGTGIGLALTKELVELHHGKIEVSSEPGKATTFSIYLPLGKDHLKPEEIVQEMETGDWKPPVRLAPPDGETGKEMLPLIGSTENTRHTTQDSEVQTETSGRSTVSRLRSTDSMLSSPVSLSDWRRQAGGLPPPLLLIVEDNPDMRSYLRDCLQAKFRLLEAADGEEGLRQAIDQIPDFIICDVMMPKMDGFAFCERIKTDERTSHIPVILLTARADAESKITGLETGADDYLSKPFNARELQVRIKNLLDQRQRLQERFSREFLLIPQKVDYTSINDAFLRRAIEIVKEKIPDPEFNVTRFGKEIGLSRSQLHRKLQALTNQSPTEFIRSLRLKNAAYLLRKKTGNIAEIAFQVGFNNLSYFSKCFRQQFGKSPSAYLKI